jgi:hypothetical protein
VRHLLFFDGYNANIAACFDGSAELDNDRLKVHFIKIMTKDIAKHLVAEGHVFHLITLASQGKPLCGIVSPSLLIGSYVEHLETSGDEVRWVREVFGPGGKPVRGCERCLDAFPSELKRIAPFEIDVKVRFEPDRAFSGYDVTASAIAQIGNRQEPVKAYPLVPFVTARRLHQLQFEIEVFANSIVPWIQHANKS